MNRPPQKQSSDSGEERKAPKYPKGTKSIIVLFFTGGGRVQADTPHSADEFNTMMNVPGETQVLVTNMNDDAFVKRDNIVFYRKDVIFYNIAELDLEKIEKAQSLEASGLIVPPNAGKLSLQ